MSLNYTPET